MRTRKAAKKKAAKTGGGRTSWPRHSRRATKSPARAGHPDEGVIGLFVSTYRSLG